MESALGLPAPAKLNLFLHVTGRRADGYHTLQTAFQLIDLADWLDFERRGDGQIVREGERSATAGFEESNTRPDRDFDLYYSLSPDAIAVNLLSYKPYDEDGYFLLLVSGLVEAVNLRTTVLRDLEGTVHIVPNGVVDTVTNRTREWSRDGCPLVRLVEGSGGGGSVKSLESLGYTYVPYLPAGWDPRPSKDPAQRSSASPTSVVRSSSRLNFSQAVSGTSRQQWQAAPLTRSPDWGTGSLAKAAAGCASRANPDRGSDWTLRPAAVHLVSFLTGNPLPRTLPGLLHLDMVDYGWSWAREFT